MNCKALAIGATALGIATSALAQDKTLTISVYSFSQDEFKELVYDPFEEICGCSIVVETGNSVERLAKIEANRENPVIDMAAISTHDALGAARKGLLQPIDVSRLGNYEILYDIAKDPLGDNLGIGYTFYATSIVYRSDKVEVDSWADLLSPELAGNVAFPNIDTTGGPPSLYMLGKALGDASHSLETPINRVGESADDIVTFYVRSSQLAQLIQQEEVWAAPSWPVRLGPDQGQRLANGVGHAQGGPDRRHERLGHDCRQRERGSGASIHGLLALHGGADPACRGADRQPRELRSDGVRGRGGQSHLWRGYRCDP